MSINCPKCGSYDVHTGKRGFDLMAGGVLGMNRLISTCLECGFKFYPPKYRPKLVLNELTVMFAVVTIVAVLIFAVDQMMHQ